MEPITTTTNIDVVTFIAVVMVLMNVFNVVMNAIHNGKKASEMAKEPFVRIDQTVADIRNKCDLHVKEIDERVDNLERRLNEHDTDLKDLHAGQSALCRGVQALLDHELHNGNEDEMRSASESIGKWLRTR